MYAYLIGTIGLAIVFLALYIARKDLRRVMIYSGLVYLTYMSACFFLLKTLSSDPAKSINPGYWTPPSLFDLNHRTGGLGIEDVLFMFFAPAIIAGIYELFFNIKINKKIDKRLKKGHALLIGLVAGSAAYALTPLNAMYFLIFFQLFGALAIVVQRKDLIKHAVAGGFLFAVFYGVLFSIFNLLYPTFISNYDNLQRTSHILLLNIPLEEFLYAFTMGLMWAPLYEYMHKVKDSKRRLLVPRRFSLAAGATRR